MLTRAGEVLVALGVLLSIGGLACFDWRAAAVASGVVLLVFGCLLVMRGD